MTVRITSIALAVLTALGMSMPLGAAAASKPVSLADQVAEADAIVVGKVGAIESKRWLLTLFEKDSDGQKPTLTTSYDLAVLHPENVLKTDSDSIVNKVDASNPVAWMHMAFPTPGQKGGLNRDLWSPVTSNGEYRIWLLRRDMILTGHYFLRGALNVTGDRIREIKALIATPQTTQGASRDISIVVADPDGEIRLNGDPVQFDALREKLETLASPQERGRTHVQMLRPSPSPNRNSPEADKKAAAVIQLLRDLGFDKVEDMAR